MSVIETFKKAPDQGQESPVPVRAYRTGIQDVGGMAVLGIGAIHRPDGHEPPQTMVKHEVAGETIGGDPILHLPDADN